MRRGVSVWGLVAVLAALGALAFALTRGGGDTSAGPGGGEDDLGAVTWDEIVDRAQGETVRLWMWGGEAALNAYIDRQAVPAAADLGVTLERVPLDDTATAIGRLVDEAEAAAAGDGGDGAIDLLWVNGKNFEQGARAGLWRTGWVDALPNAELFDADDPTLWNDFGVPTEGAEMPWSRAAFVFAHDSARLADPPRSFEALVDHARSNPGRVAYPAPPDFTGSAFVRQAVQALGEDEAFALLAELDPLLWRRGDTYPLDQAELEQLFAAGEIDLAMSYNPNFVDIAVRRGSFPDTVAPYVFDGGTLQNVSFLAIPATSARPEAAMVVADLLASPRQQAAKLDLVGIPSVLPPDALEGFGAPSASPHRLADHGPPLEELPAERVPEIDRRWIDELGR